MAQGVRDRERLGERAVVGDRRDLVQRVLGGQDTSLGVVGIRPDLAPLVGGGQDVLA